MVGELLLAVWYLLFIAGLMTILFTGLDAGWELLKRTRRRWRPRQRP